MFGFMKKDKEKDKDKKDRKDKKKDKKDKQKERPSFSQEELNRLEEMNKKAMFRRPSDRDRSGKTTTSVPNSESNESSLSSASEDGLRPSPSREIVDQPDGRKVALTRPQPPPGSQSSRKPPPPTKPKPKSILKEKSFKGSLGVSSDIDDNRTLQENTYRNENYVDNGSQNPENQDAYALNARTNGTHLESSIPTIIEPPESPKEKSYDVELKLPEIIPAKPSRVRTLVLKRQAAGGFGFSLRKSFIQERNQSGQEKKKTIIFAEPTAGTKGVNTGLVPGDRLIEVNSSNVENCTREEVVEKIRSCGDSVTLKVQPIKELSELSSRPGSDGVKLDVQDDMVKGGTLNRSGSLRYKKGAKTEDDLKSEKAWLEAEKIWLIHKGGFASGKLQTANGMSPLPDGRVRVKLDGSGDVLDVDEEDIEKSNPPQFDRAEDLASLRYLNESSVLHTLRQRFGNNQIHTYAGPSLLITNPMEQMPVLYTNEVIHMFKGCKQEDMPPHIYSSAQIAYREMLSSRRDQSIILTGRSGSGKTTNLKHILHYFAVASGSVNNMFTVEKLNAIMTLLHSFGNSRTILNTNGSRYTQVTTLDFDHAGQIVSASLQALMFEKTRVVRRPESEPTFHVFYQLLAGVDSNLRNELQLTVLDEPNQFMTPLQRTEDRQVAAQRWALLQNAMDIVGMNEGEVKAICCVLAAIYHLGAAGVTKGNNNKPQFAKPAAAQRASSLLGISVEELGRNIFTAGGLPGTLTRGIAMRNNLGDRQSEVSTSASEALEGFVTGLYADVFNGVVALINRSLSSNYRSITSIAILDMPGFQNPATCGRQSGASFEDLCHNYAQEKIQLLYHDLTFTLQQDRYAQENIECDFEFVTTSPAALVSLIDRSTQQAMMRTSNPDLRDMEKKGLLWLLDEEALYPGATEDSFMDRLFSQHGEQHARKDSLLRKGNKGSIFILNHYQGTNPVHYNATGWLRICRENPLCKVATMVLQDSNKPHISELFNAVRGPVASTMSGSVVGMEGSTSLKRVSSMRRTYTSGTAGIKRKSVCLQIKFQMDSIIETLRKTKCHFVHCLLPQMNAGLCELKMTSNQSPQSPRKTENQDGGLMHVPMLRSQIRGGEILEGIRIYRQGFPDHMQFSDFHQRFEILAPDSGKEGSGMEESQAMKSLLDHLDVDQLNYRIGLSQVFFRAGALGQLEVARDEKITGMLIDYQAYCRGYLGRKNVQKRRVQHMAISCIQKNVNKFMFIRDWDWWKLYTKVKPLLNVHRTEEELRNKDLELEHMKAKLEKLEKDRNDYKQQCEKLDARLSEITADLADENTTSSHATEMLDVETAERMRLEKELKDITGKYNNLKRNSERLQMEVMQSRLWQASAIDGELEEEDIEGSLYKERYERTLRELDITKKSLHHEHGEDMEKEQATRKHLEKRLHEAVAETEEQRRLVGAAKKKSQRLVSEFQDTKRHLEEQMARNNELERKQRRFDAELGHAHEEVKEEKGMRDKIIRERDQLLGAKFSLEQEVQKTNVEMESKASMVATLNKELNELTYSGSKDDNEIVSMKRMKHELEKKLKDQEEELDDQAAQIQQLEQSRLRLEMTLEKARQQNLKDLEEKDEELEEMRRGTQRKVKQLEKQQEEDYEEKKALQQEKRELERRINELGTKTPQRDREAEKRLRRDLKKTKALLKDAEGVLQKQKSSEGAKATIRTLRNQLEDLEFSSAAAIKSKKAMDAELQDLQQQLEDISTSKQESEERCIAVLREKSDIQSKLEENEEDMTELLRTYKVVVQQQSVDHITLSDQLGQIQELTIDRDTLKQQISDLSHQVHLTENSTVDKHVVTRLENKVRELENKLELEQTTKHRFELQLSRTKEVVDKLNMEKADLQHNKQQGDEVVKRVQRQLRDLREEFTDAQKRELEASQRKQELEAQVEELEVDLTQSQSDLKLALKRITDLQASLEDDLNSDDDDFLGDSDDDSDSDLDTFLEMRRRDPLSRLSSYSSSPRSRTHSAASSDYMPDSPRGAMGNVSYS